MSRETTYEMKPAVPQLVRHAVTTITCDKCRRKLDFENVEEDFANELAIYLNADECVNQKFRLDLCTDCLEPIWQDLCHLIGRDPEDISGSDFNGDYD